jgi:Protein of unknown function (DUF3558)
MSKAPPAAAAAALAVMLSLLVAGCGTIPTSHTANPDPPTHSASGGGASSAIDPCTLLTQPEVDTAAGQPLGAGQRAGALQVCQWSSSDFAGSVELTVGDWSAIHASAVANGQTPTSVSGVGDEALTLNQEGNSAQLYVRKGLSGFALLLGGAQYTDTLPDLGLAHEEALAAAVLGRL